MAHAHAGVSRTLASPAGIGLPLDPSDESEPARLWLPPSAKPVGLDSGRGPVEPSGGEGSWRWSTGHGGSRAGQGMGLPLSDEDLVEGDVGGPATADGGAVESAGGSSVGTVVGAVDGGVGFWAASGHTMSTHTNGEEELLGGVLEEAEISIPARAVSVTGTKSQVRDEGRKATDAGTTQPTASTDATAAAGQGQVGSSKAAAGSGVDGLGRILEAAGSGLETASVDPDAAGEGTSGKETTGGVCSSGSGMESAPIDPDAAGEVAASARASVESSGVSVAAGLTAAESAGAAFGVMELSQAQEQRGGSAAADGKSKAGCGDEWGCDDLSSWEEDVEGREEEEL